MPHAPAPRTGRLHRGHPFAARSAVRNPSPISPDGPESLYAKPLHLTYVLHTYVGTYISPTAMYTSFVQVPRSDASSSRHHESRLAPRTHNRCPRACPGACPDHHGRGGLPNKNARPRQWRLSSPCLTTPLARLSSARIGREPKKLHAVMHAAREPRPLLATAAVRRLARPSTRPSQAKRPPVLQRA